MGIGGVELLDYPVWIRIFRHPPGMHSKANRHVSQRREKRARIKVLLGGDRVVEHISLGELERVVVAMARQDKGMDTLLQEAIIETGTRVGIDRCASRGIDIVALPDGT